MNRIGRANPVRIVRYDAMAVEDADRVQRVSLGPGSLLLRVEKDGAEVLAVGRPSEVDSHPANRWAERVPLPSSVLIPGLVNAHTHLDLTHIGPQPYEPGAGFVGFVERVRARRKTDVFEIAQSVRMGMDLCVAGGTVAVGDIAGGRGLEAYRTLRRGRLAGVSFKEFFGIGTAAERGRRAAAEAIDEAQRLRESCVRFGLQPHAPYSVSLESYRWAAAEAGQRGLPLCTHLAESPEEAQFVAQGTGPIRAFLDRVGIWDESLLREIGQGKRPVEHLAEVLRMTPFVLAHVNQASDDDVQTLARTGAHVAYCPRASAYFGAERVFGPHRYRDMLAAGVNVCLGTDSIINLPERAADGRAGGISVLDEMRFLWRRDGTDARALLAMGTVNGARALGLDAGRFSFASGSRPYGVLAVEAPQADSRPPLERVMACDVAAQWLEGAGRPTRERGSQRNMA